MPRLRCPYVSAWTTPLDRLSEFLPCTPRGEPLKPITAAQGGSDNLSDGSMRVTNGVVYTCLASGRQPSSTCCTVTPDSGRHRQDLSYIFTSSLRPDWLLPLLFIKSLFTFFVLSFLLKKVLIFFYSLCTHFSP